VFCFIFFICVPFFLSFVTKYEYLAGFVREREGAGAGGGGWGVGTGITAVDMVFFCGFTSIIYIWTREPKFLGVFFFVSNQASMSSQLTLGLLGAGGGGREEGCGEKGKYGS